MANVNRSGVKNLLKIAGLTLAGPGPIDKKDSWRRKPGAKSLQSASLFLE